MQRGNPRCSQQRQDCSPKPINSSLNVHKKKDRGEENKTNPSKSKAALKSLSHSLSLSLSLSLDVTQTFLKRFKFSVKEYWFLSNIPAPKRLWVFSPHKLLKKIQDGSSCQNHPLNKDPYLGE